uniref:MFS general substrate transporter n=1 Tax=Moniliophthora roreri TaxID=221103 RepID=A0A0W0FN46_MONRR
MSLAFGGLLAAAIVQMDGVGGKPAWAWIFILEGLVTVVAGAFSFRIIQDFPDTAKFLTEAERTVVIRCLQDDDQISATGEKLRWKYIRMGFLDWKTWLGRFAANRMVANLLTVPIYVFACKAISILCSSVWVGVTFLIPAPGLNSSSIIGAIGYIILISSRKAALSYFAVFLASCAIFPNIPNTIAWMSNNIEGSYKHSVTLAMVIGFGNINSAVSLNIYRARDVPWYTLGHVLALMYIAIGIITSCIYLFFVKQENAKRERGEWNKIIGDSKTGHEKNGGYNSVADVKREKGDGYSGYCYTI